ncbi:hypothetical protein [Saccharopolyspora phatthalungensis]|uniref:Uncharacterized protein n=1 Tax=Saccharopolyspora phatthalungensis TaxID=664693 RepID=A0A840QFR2_9PSEU|nr:hypothetical protein [Saccharopolyspora phatthalungensis]MBB5157439.1 hypothetical protein [Saccharopolyspora phatthalungensis]
MTYTSTPATHHATGLAGRALNAAHAHRATDPGGFTHRHDNSPQWTRWKRRARVARTIAAALQIPISRVTITDDTQRDYRARSGEVPGDLITITDRPAARRWHFIPDLATPGDGWLMIDSCPGCGAAVPRTRIATLADLGDYLNPHHPIQHPEEFHSDPAHLAGCNAIQPPPKHNT